MQHGTTVPEVVSVKIARKELTAAEVPALRELFRLERLPLAEAYVEIELKGVSGAVANALRRVVTDEMPGRCLRVPPDGFDLEMTTDRFMLPQFVNQLRISLLPLRPQIPPEIVRDLRLQLDVTNTGASPLSVYAGDLEVTAGRMPEPLVNPTFKLAVLQPGARLVIRGIYISTGYGRDDGAYIVARRAVCRPLDIPERPEAETHDEGGAAVDESGFLVSCLVAEPRRHLLRATLPATSANLAEVRAVFADGCAIIKERLRLVVSTIERRGAALGEGAASKPAPLRAGAQFTLVRLQEGLFEGILQVPEETHTIGALLCRAVSDLAPDISYVAYHIISHEDRLHLTVRHTEAVDRILLGAAQQCVATFEAIQRGISSAR